jgi:hypothetical protein
MTNETPSARLADYASVSVWLQGLPPAPVVRQRHLQALAEFCAAEDSDPDALIEAGRAGRDNKHDAMRRLRAWVATRDCTERERHDLENAVRSFYIANGLRVLTKPYADVYRRSPGN